MCFCCNVLEDICNDDDLMKTVMLENGYYILKTDDGQFQVAESTVFSHINFKICKCLCLVFVKKIKSIVYVCASLCSPEKCFLKFDARLHRQYVF